MPRKTNSSPPPKVMTWGKATPVLAICVIFDALRLMFNMFWFFAPALAALYCTTKISGALTSWTLGLLGTKTAAVACSAGAGVIGFYSAAAITAFGVVMALAVGLMGWLAVGLIMLITNSRILKENALWFAGGLLVSEVPIINSLPALTGITWRMYHKQIRVEKAEMKKWEKTQADAQLQERNRQAAELMQARLTEATSADV